MSDTVPESTNNATNNAPESAPARPHAPLIAAASVALLALIALAWLRPSPADYCKPIASADEELATALRIRKVGSIHFAQAAPAGARKPRAGEAVFKAQCAACHATGVSGAPKFGNAAEWAPRISQGFEALVRSAAQGKGAMPAQAGGAASELEVARAVAYMANAAGGKFEEPAAPAAE